MKKNDFKGVDLIYYRETLENGLEVVMVPMTDKKNYYISYATRYGSDITNFTTSDGTNIVVPNGIAHFLEHKMFEQENGVDPFSYFSKSGTDCNASTSFEYTQYICYGTKCFGDNLRYLIKFVNSPYYTDENVEKEKGIIAQEIKMYKDMPDFQLEMKLRENIYHTCPRRIDIAGEVEDINKITKEDLYNCYNNFYSPNNMILFIVGNFNYKEASKIIYEELELKENRDYPKINMEKEKKSVREKYEVIKGNIEVPKLAYGLKICTDKFTDYSPIVLDLYLSMISTLIYGSTSLFIERVKENHLLLNMCTETESVDNFRIFYLMAESNDPDSLLEEIKKESKGFKFKEEDFERIKKVWIADEVYTSDTVNSVMRTIFHDMFYYKEVINDRVDKIKSLDFKTMLKIYKDIDLNNCSAVIMKPKK